MKVCYNMYKTNCTSYYIMSVYTSVLTAIERHISVCVCQTVGWFSGTYWNSFHEENTQCVGSLSEHSHLSQLNG